MKTNELELIVLQLAKKVDEAVSGDIEELLNQVKEDCTTYADVKNNLRRVEMDISWEHQFEAKTASWLLNKIYSIIENELNNLKIK